jgi:superfamily II DNA or RNA helicase
LIITGYTSLPLVIDLLAHYCGRSRETHVRLLLGHEPRPLGRSTYRGPGPQTFSRELEDYWLGQGISVYQSVEVLAAIDFLQTDSIEVRISGTPGHPVHAKIYRADHAITLGSSNLSNNGMYSQLEANERHEVFDYERFAQACALAEQIWATGRDYRQQLIALLQRLLSAVSWQEALARACAEVLDGLWARRYTLADPLVNAPQLWPAQEQGVVQAMWLVDQVGSVLVADATGSGKTRLGAEILRAMTNRLWERGRVRNHIPVIVAPPRVLPDWERATTSINLPSERYAHSLLSRTPGEKHQVRQDVLQRAQVLAIDEAHNFLNTTSNRSRALLRCAPEHTLLLTATPLNRELSDLLTIINLLGPDNFDDHIINLVLQAAQVRPSARGKATTALPISPDEIALLQRAIRQFMLRRTKRQFNALIDQEPEAYRNRLGKPCRYPETRAQYYDTGETADDQRWITAVRRALEQMTGMAFVHKVLRVPDSPRWRKHPDPERTWVNSMLQSAKALAGYHVLAALRSSRIAALEHLFGTHAAWRECVGEPVPLKQAAQTGNLYERVQQLGGKLPANMLELTDLPAILTDPESHRRACERDAQIYDAIGKIIRKISDQRETTKARLIADLIERHSLVVAFDARPITLHEIARRLANDRIQIRIATAERPHDCRKVMHEFQLGSQASHIVALCTDAMSESINLQAASAIVHLDLPTVVRRLEQRDGRLSRMDSDHREVESWLPRDSPAFAPTSGEELIYRRYRMVETLLGGNVVLPDDPALADPEEEDLEADDAPPATLITPESIVRDRDQREQVLDAIPDAFSPVRSLVIGDQALVSPATYEHYRRGQARVVSSVAAVRAEKPWVFLCLAGSDTGAPRFVLMSSDDEAPQTGLEEICEQLRSWLGPHTPQRSFDHAAAEQLEAYLKRLNTQDELLLPRKKRRALAEMRAILPKYRSKPQRRRGKADEVADPDDASTGRTAVVDTLLDLLNNRGERHASDGRRITPDLGILADRWLYLIRPAWTEVARSSRRKILLLRDLREHLLKHPPETTELEQLLYEEGLWVRPLDERVVAAIVGVPDQAI